MVGRPEVEEDLVAAFHNLELGERKLEGHRSLVEEHRILEVHQLEFTGIDRDYHPLEKRELSC